MIRSKADFDTGDNPPLSGSALKRACEILIKTRRADMLRPIKDGRGRYAYLMREPVTKQLFFLVARDSAPWPSAGNVLIVSTQLALVNIAADSGYPILLAWFPDKKRDEMALMLYNPEEIRSKAWDDENLNKRFGSKMVNYEYLLGESIQNVVNMKAHWARLRQRWENEKKFGPVQAKLGGSYEIASKHPGLGPIVHCKCGAEYSREKFVKCPACGKSLYPTPNQKVNLK